MTPQLLSVMAAGLVVVLSALATSLPNRISARNARHRALVLSQSTVRSASRVGAVPVRSTVLAVGGVFVAWLVLVHGPVLGLSGALLFGVGWVAVQSTQTQRQLNQYESAIPRWLDDITRSLRSGSGFLTALEEAAGRARGSFATDANLMVHRAKAGDGLGHALRHWQQSRPTPSVRLCVGAMTLAMRTGGSQAQAIDSAAATVRQALVARDVARTHAAEARASAAALTVLPVIVSGPMLLTNEDARTFMFSTFAGQLCLLIGLLLNIGGALWMSWLIRRTES